MSEDEARSLWPHHLAAYVASGVTTVLDTGILEEDAERLVELASQGPAPTLRFLGPLVSPDGGYLNAVLPAFEPTRTADELTAQLEAFDHLDPVGVKVTMEDGMLRPIWPLHQQPVLDALREQHRPLFVHAIETHEYELALTIAPAAFVHPPDRVYPSLVERLADIPVVTTLAVFDTMLVPAQPERLSDELVRLVVPAVELENSASADLTKRSNTVVLSHVMPRLPGFMHGMVATMMVKEGPIRKRLQQVQDVVVTLHEGGVELVAGSDSGNWPVFLHEWHGPTTIRELELLQEAGIPRADVITIGTLNGARLVGLEAEIGTIEVGKRADFIGVEGDPLSDVGILRKARWVVRDGDRRTPEAWMSAVR